MDPYRNSQENCPLRADQVSFSIKDKINLWNKKRKQIKDQQLKRLHIQNQKDKKLKKEADNWNVELFWIEVVEPKIISNFRIGIPYSTIKTNDLSGYQIDKVIQYGKNLGYSMSINMYEIEVDSRFFNRNLRAFMAIISINVIFYSSLIVLASQCN